MIRFGNALAAACLVACAAAMPARAADDPSLSQGFIKIMKPSDGAEVSGGSVDVTYWARLTPEGDHFVVTVDKGHPMVDRKVINCPCTVKLSDLSAGAHTVTIQEATTTGELMPLTQSAKFTVK